MSESFGARLRQRREERQIDLITIAEQTKIKLALLEALERDDVSHWPSGIFRRAYIRTYAQFISLDPDIVLREFLEVHPDPDDVFAALAEVAGDASRTNAAPPTRLRTMVDSAIGSLARLRRPAATDHTSPIGSVPPLRGSAPTAVDVLAVPPLLAASQAETTYDRLPELAPSSGPELAEPVPAFDAQPSLEHKEVDQTGEPAVEVSACEPPVPPMPDLLADDHGRGDLGGAGGADEASEPTTRETQATNGRTSAASEPHERRGDRRGPRERVCRGVRPASAAKRLRRGLAGARPPNSAGEGGRGEAPRLKEAILEAIAHLCTEFGRVGSRSEVEQLLQDSASALGATGLIVWLWDEVAEELTPALVHGYSERVLAHLPAVRQDADNATAAAFRSANTCEVAATAYTSGALVIPLLVPERCAGVLAIELEQGVEPTGSVRAVATLLAAALAQLVNRSQSAEVRTPVEPTVPAVTTSRPPVHPARVRR